MGPFDEEIAFLFDLAEGAVSVVSDELVPPLERIEYLEHELAAMSHEYIRNQLTLFRPDLVETWDAARTSAALGDRAGWSTHRAEWNDEPHR